MTGRFAVALGCAAAASMAGVILAAAEPADEAARTRDVLDRYCVTCHNERLRTGGLVLEPAAVDTGDVHRDAAVWEKVIRKLQAGVMPPRPRPRPDRAAAAAVVAYLETALDRAAAVHPNPGRPAVQRLNRAEYVNAVRDLVALEVDGRELLPPDESGYGFDNVGAVLSMSPGLMERYLLAAAKVSRRAVGDPTLRAATTTYPVSPLLAQDERLSEELPFGSRGGVVVRHHFPLDAEYVVTVTLRGRGRAGHQLDVRLDRERVRLFDLARNEPLVMRLPVTAGTRSIGVSFVGTLDSTLPIDGRPPMPPIRSFGFTQHVSTPAVASVAIDGPHAGRVPGDTPSRRAIFVCRPADSSEEASCARRIVAKLARRAYRRPLDDKDIEPLVAAYERGRHEGHGFDEGIRWAVEAILVSPKFLFRVEHEPADAAPGAPFRLSALDLASRLSFFLWSSLPDDELIALGAGGDLHMPEVLEQQVRRLLADDRARALVDNFVGQWLYLRNLRTAAPDPLQFPDFDDNLRQAMRRETELFVASQLREDRSVRDLLRADYTFVNERLAQHYDMNGVYGSQFRRVNYTNDRRAGLLGHGSVMTVTSYPDRTSPVVRGKWLLENLLGAPPPPPPPDVPQLLESGTETASLTMRERMAQHRSHPGCASCHAKIDPLGFALENFDAVGRWRDHAAPGGARIDASGVLPDGTAFDGPASFRAALASEPWATEFVRTVVEKLLVYALGRGLEASDAPAVREIMRAAAEQDYRWSSIILGVVNSTPFQMRSAEGQVRVSTEQGGPGGETSC